MVLGINKCQLCASKSARAASKPRSYDCGSDTSSVCILSDFNRKLQLFPRLTPYKVIDPSSEPRLKIISGFNRFPPYCPFIYILFAGNRNISKKIGPIWDLELALDFCPSHFKGRTPNKINHNHEQKKITVHTIGYKRRKVMKANKDR
jgi:hypothetical protein